MDEKEVQPLTEEIRAFCETTSVRGIPRTVKANDKIVFIVWLCGVIGCTAMLLWQLSLVLMRYFSFQVTNALSESWQNPTFPDITVCNISPLIYQKYYAVDYITYVNLIATLYNDPIYGAKIKADIISSKIDILGFLPSPAAYLNTFNVTDTFTLDPANPMILSCSYFDWNDAEYPVTCTETIRASWDPLYHKCFTLKLNDTDRKKVRSLSAVIYAERFRDSLVEEYDLNPRYSHAAGARVAIHSPGTPADMAIGMSLSPGRLSSIVMSQTKRKRLPDPYTNCTTAKSLVNDTGVAYTQDYCYDSCAQRQLIEKCQCFDSQNMITVAQMRSVNFTACQNVSNPFFWSALVCETNFIIDDDACDAECYIPCNENIYTPSLSSAFWPQNSALLSFYRTFVDENPQFAAGAFGNVQIPALGPNATAAETSAVLNALLNQSVIENNFLQLNVRFGSPEFDGQNDVPAMTADQMGALVGGVLMLYLGLTLTFIFELVESCYKYCMRRRQAANSVDINHVQVVPSKETAM